MHSIRSTSSATTVHREAKQSAHLESTSDVSRSKTAVFEMIQAGTHKPSRERPLEYRRELSPDPYLGTSKYGEQDSRIRGRKSSRSVSPSRLERRYLGNAAYSPERSTRFSPERRRERSPELFQFLPDTEKYSPERQRVVSDRRRSSLDRRRDSRERRRSSPGNHNISRRQGSSPDRRKPLPETRRLSPDRHRMSPIKRRVSPGQRGGSPESRRSQERRGKNSRASPERPRRGRSPGRLGRSYEHRTSSTKQRSSPRKSRSPGRIASLPPGKRALQGGNKFVANEDAKKVAPMKRKRRLSPLVLTTGAHEVLTKQIETTWQNYYHKYYNCVVTNPEIVLELQKEYLRSYRGFFKENPHFEYYYVKVAKPEDLREALTLRIDRGSPGPDPNAPNPSAVELPPPRQYNWSPDRFLQPPPNQSSRRSRSPQLRNLDLHKPSTKKSASPPRKMQSSHQVSSQSPMVSDKTPNSTARSTVNKPNIAKSLVSDKVYRDGSKEEFDNRVAQPAKPAQRFLPESNKSGDVRLPPPSHSHSKTRLEATNTRASSPLPPPRAPSPLPAAGSRRSTPAVPDKSAASNSLPTENLAAVMKPKSGAFKENAPNIIPKQSISNVDTPSRKSDGIFPEACDISTHIASKKSEPSSREDRFKDRSREDRFKDRDEQVATNALKNKTTKEGTENSRFQAIERKAGHHSENEPIITSTTQGFPLERKRIEASRDTAKSRSVLGRLGPKRKQGISPTKDDRKRTERSNISPPRKGGRTSRDVADRQGHSPKSSKRRRSRTTDRRLTHGSTAVLDSSTSGTKTEDPAISKVYNIVSSLLHILVILQLSKVQYSGLIVSFGIFL